LRLTAKDSQSGRFMVVVALARMLSGRRNSMSHIHSYSQIFAAGHRYVNDILNGEVIVQEKVDGSQFSMQLLNGELSCRSKGKDIEIGFPEKLFAKAIETAKSLPLHDGWVYRCEYLSKEKHNSLTYGRIPNKHLIVYDIDTTGQNYIVYEDVVKESARIGLECVPMFYRGKLEKYDDVRKYLTLPSILGGALEGVVIKNYALYGQDKKVLMAKIVRDEFKEVHKTEWKLSNPTQSDVLQMLIGRYKTDARFEKAYQHLNEKGEILRECKDIPKLMKEVQEDIKKECEDEIKQMLFSHFWESIKRSSIGGLPEWYKRKLTECKDADA
jgi:hypothetical protein